MRKNKDAQSANNRVFRLAVNPLFLLVLALVAGAISITSLRNNNLHMEQLKKAVYSADKSGQGVSQALDNLQAYVTSHMNTDLSTGTGSVYPPIQLEYTYLRLVQAEDKAALSSNTGLYTAAQNYCQQQDPYDFSGHNRVPCIEQYVTNHGSSLPTVPASLYEFDFISPTWSPDLAGWSLVATISLAILTVVSFIYRLYHKKLASR